MPMQKVDPTVQDLIEKVFTAFHLEKKITNQHAEEIKSGLLVVITSACAQAYKAGKRDGTRETLAFISKEEGWDSPDVYKLMKKLGLSNNQD